MAIKHGSIYCLIDPNTKLVRYIGLTINLLKIRLNEHISTSKCDKSNQHKSNWIKSLLKENKKLIIKLISKHNIEDLPKAEIEYIGLYNSLQGNEKILTNCSVVETEIYANKTISVIRSDGTIYSSIKQASRENNILKCNISNCISGRSQHAGGYGWKYYKGTKETWEVNIIKGKPLHRSDGKTFKNMCLAAKELNVTPQAITQALKRNGTVKGFHFTRE